ncbi:NDR1/HIN1-like protein 10 [Lactuca sativa]|uniref:NDR1/HIN1-like protein 10 n=1 Tax=Lactuca sativa TaxID=4236 RepID=UPI000CC2D1B3|nr:NDR1/HIN1-like protein 10 [Lactuca sativa]
MADQTRHITGNRGHSGATVHPYVSRPPNAAQNQPTFNSNPNASRLRATLHCFIIILVGFIITIVIFFFFSWMLWLDLNSRHPLFRVETLTLSNFSISSNSLISGKLDANFVVRNPSLRNTLYYDKIEADLFYKSDLISVAILLPFMQGTNNETAIRATFASLTGHVDDRDRDSIINGEKMIKFKVVMIVRVKASAWGVGRTTFSVYCYNLRIGISSKGNGGTLVGGSKKCPVVV